MTRDDIRKLIGGYATGSLTEAERKFLFEAALDDQELFDELAREQPLKELIEEPGARERLIAALDSRQPARAWWKQPWPWAAAAGISLGLIVLVSTIGIMRRQPPKPVEVAAVTQPEARMEAKPPAPAAPVANAPAVKTLPKTSQKPTPAPVQAIADQTPKEKAKDKDARRDESSEDLKVKAEAPAAAPAPVTQTRATIAAAPAAPPQQAAAPSPRVQQETQETAQRQFSGKVGNLTKAARFALAYKIESGGYVSVTVTGDGYLRVETPVVSPIATDLHVLNGSTTRLKIPEGAAELTIAFSAAPLGAGNAVAIGRIAGGDGLRSNLDRLSAKKTDPSGTIQDPNPSPNSRLVVTVQLH